MVVHSCNPSMWEAEAGRLQVQVNMGCLIETREMTQWVKCLLCKPEDLSLGSQYSYKNPDVVAYTYNVSTREEETQMPRVAGQII